jgi:hypothetical protein
MLLMERPFEVGDHIEIGDVSGEVKEINWRSVHLKAFGGLTQVVPNSVLNKEVITNYSRPRRMRMEMVEVSFSYDDAPNDVRETLLAVAAETPGLLSAPAPIAATLNFGDFGITYRLIYWTLEEDRWPVRGELMTRIWYAARRRGLAAAEQGEQGEEGGGGAAHDRTTRGADRRRRLRGGCGVGAAGPRRDGPGRRSPRADVQHDTAARRRVRGPPFGAQGRQPRAARPRSPRRARRGGGPRPPAARQCACYDSRLLPLYRPPG